MKKIVFARSIAHVLEKYLLEADTSIHWVSVVGEGIPLHTSSRLAELSGVAGALDKDGYLLQTQP